jgi:ABC-type glycerol-3-phosphate transport system substrate-binding protein
MTLNGKHFGHPTWVQAFWLYYNKKLFDGAGMPYPDVNTSFEDYVAMCQKLTKTDASGMIVQYGAAGWASWNMPICNDVWTAGGHFYYNDNQTEIQMTDPQTIKALQDEGDMMNKFKIHPSPLSPPTTPATLLSGKVATQFDGDWYPFDQKAQWSEDYDATLTPMRNGNRTEVYWCEPLVVNADSKAPEAAYKWLAWFGGNIEATKIQCQVVLPTYKKAYEDPDIIKQWLVYPRPAGHTKLITEHPKFKKWWKAEPHGPEFENTILTSELDKLWRNVATAEEVCATIQTKGNELMKQPIA